jgi:hypothetical protein
MWGTQLFSPTSMVNFVKKFPEKPLRGFYLFFSKFCNNEKFGHKKKTLVLICVLFWIL